MKEDLIKLFEKTCSNFSVSRNNKCFELDIDIDTSEKIINFLPNTIEIPDDKKSFTSYNFCFPHYFIGFKFKEEPPIAIGIFSKAYSVKYGYLFPIISYAFWNNYINRKKYKNFIKKNWDEKVNKNFCCDTLFKTIEFEKITRFIVHGSIVAEISFEEYNRLLNLYKRKAEEYDIFKLKERLEKD